MQTGCNARTPRCKNARDYRFALNECCRQHVIQICTSVANAFRDAGVRFWIDYGSLLGAVRNSMTSWADYPWLPRSDTPIAPGIVPHDKDADWGMLIEDWHAAVKAVRTLERTEKFAAMYRQEQMQRPKGSARTTVVWMPGSIKVRLSRLNHTNLDVFCWRNDAGIMRRARYIEVDKYKGREFPASMLEPMSSVMWEGIELPAPADPEAFLEMRYGPNWRTPVCANNDGVLR